MTIDRSKTLGKLIDNYYQLNSINSVNETDRLKELINSIYSCTLKLTIEKRIKLKRFMVFRDTLDNILNPEDDDNTCSVVENIGVLRSELSDLFNELRPLCLEHRYWSILKDDKYEE